MSESKAEKLARTWIELWNQNRPDDIPLAESFTHTSPFGQVSGRGKYLDWVKPMAKENVADLKIVKTLGNDTEAVIQFEMHTPNGMIPVCDWVSIEGDEITAIHSFYDATNLR